MTRYGDHLIYACPKCGKHYYETQTISSNNFGGITYDFYTDGITLYSGSTCSVITKCEKCKNYFWLDDHIGTVPLCGMRSPRRELLKLVNVPEAHLSNWEKNEKELKWEYAEAVNYGLKLHELKRILKGELSQPQEKYVRKEIWYKFNDRLRKGKEIFLNEKEELFWIKNTEALIKLMDSLILVKAELYRNLGDFKKCSEILNTIDEKLYKRHHLYEYSTYKQIIKECKKKNRWLAKVELKEPEQVE